MIRFRYALLHNEYSIYHVGDTKTVDMGPLGSHTLRIANMTDSIYCKQSTFSQTACGFVLEFADIVESRGITSGNSNVGGWSGSDIRTYLNTDFFNYLPKTLREGIEDTRVISGHGSTVSDNFVSTDKIYLMASTVGHCSYSSSGSVFGISPAFRLPMEIST